MNTSFNNSSLHLGSTSWPESNTNRPTLPRDKQIGKGAPIFMSFIMVIMILISVSGNFIVCYIVYRKPTMRSGINLLLANLALSDLLLSVISMPMAIILLNKQQLKVDQLTCNIGAIFFYKFQTEKILLLVAISIDRYFIIVRRKDNLNTFRAKIISGITWLLSLLLTLPPILGFGHYFYYKPQCILGTRVLSNTDKTFVFIFESLSGFLPCLVIVVSYSLILRTVRRNCFRVQNHPPVNPTAMHRKGKMFIDYSYKTRTFTTIAMLSIVYMLCVLPLKIVETSLALTGKETSSSLILGVLWLSYGHAALNPVIYTIRIKKFREACVDALPKPCLMIPKFMPRKTRRRIRPYALYEVGKTPAVLTTVV